MSPIGPHAVAIVAAATEAGYPIPPEAIAPPLFEVASFAYTIFRELSAGRAAPLSWADIDRAARRYGVRGTDEFDVFLRLMRAADAVWLSARK